MPLAKTRLKKVAVVIPCYNEAAGIADVIRSFPYLEVAQQGMELVVYVVDNNSSDDTAVVARQSGARVLFESRRGKGNALRTGFRQLPKDVDYVVMLDGDNTYSAAELMRLIEPLKNDFCDVVVGSRLGGRIQLAAMNQLNRLGNQLFTIATRILYRANVSDVLTGYFAWKKSALDAVVPNIVSTGFAIEMEMITKMARLGLPMASVPVSYHPRAGESTLHPFVDGWRILVMLLANLYWRPDAQPLTVAQRIVFVSDSIYPYFKGGKEKRLHEITKRLATMGHDVHIYTMHWWSSPEKVRVEAGVTLHALCKKYEMYRGDRRAIKEAIMFGLACFKLLRVRFDVLDVDHMPFFPIFSAWIVCLLSRRKLYATWHESLSREEWVSYMGIGGIIAAIVERLSIYLPHRITAASAHTKASLATNHGRVKQVELVASGIDMSTVESVDSAPTACDVLYAGRLVKDKNVDELIRALAILAKSHPKVSCLIIGQGTEKEYLQQLVRREGVSANVTFLEPLSEAAELYSYMKAAKVFCSPSVREGFGITTLEALACGTPVVTVDSPGNAAKHLVKDGHNGSVVALTPAALAAALQHWIALTTTVEDYAIAEYDWQRLAKKQAEVYSQ